MLRCMRTTLSLDDDVASRLDNLRRRRRSTFKQVVNQALREGLAVLEGPVATGAPFTTATASLGRPLLGDLDDVAQVLAVAEDERLR